MPSITFPLAFAAGPLSFVSPCVLPLVPVYLGYLSGSSLSGDAPPTCSASPLRQVGRHGPLLGTVMTIAFTEPSRAVFVGEEKV